MAKRKVVKKKRGTRSKKRPVGKGRTKGKAKPSGEPTVRESAYRLHDAEFERALGSRKYSGLIDAYLGEENYEELRELAREASKRSVRGGPRVLIVPGIMGSKLGMKRFLFFDDVIWIDPIDVAVGNLSKLALGGRPSKIIPLGVLLLAYLKLKFRLMMAGYNAEFFPYDWRRGFATLADRLAERIAAEPGTKRVHIVAHSMGGLVTRAALGRHGRQISNRIGRFIMLGTPNYGSFVPVQALRGVYPLLRQVAALDLRHSAEELAQDVFSTFPGLYQMLPAKERYHRIDLFDASNWPASGVRPNAALLSEAPAARKLLSKADDRFFLIAGVNQETTTDLHREDDTFVYHYSNEGDGTVPLAFAELPGSKTYYVEESHGSLPNNRIVAHAVRDILNEGETSVLPDRWAPMRRGVIERKTDLELAVPAFDGREGSNLSQREIRCVIDALVSPEANDRAVPPSASKHGTPTALPSAQGLANVVVGRRRQRRLDIRLAHGSITDADARAYVLGIFRGVAPSGAARALDDRLDGAITAFTRRRMFSGNVGEVFMMPTGRHAVRAETVLFAGLGTFDGFDHEVQALVAENVVRTLVRTKVEDFATVLLGASSGLSLAKSLYHQLLGVFRGLCDTDDGHRFRSITLCELDPDRYVQIRQELYRLASTSLFENFEVTFDETQLPPSVEPIRRPSVRPVGRDPIYLSVRQEYADRSKSRLRASLLGAGAKATVITDTIGISKKELRDHLAKIEQDSFRPSVLDAFGDELTRLTLPNTVVAALDGFADRHIVVVHDAPAARIPWELIRIHNRFPAAEAGLNRQYLAENLSVAKWLEQRKHGTTLDLLLVVNPTLDLPGAELEGQRIQERFAANPSVKVTLLHGEDATKRALCSRFRSGDYDLMHYAGHAFFNPESPSESGILCHGHEVLTGSDLAGIGHLPSLVVFNACESARVRKGAERKKKELEMPRRIERNVGLAEAFMRGGVANYIGTYWPVGDASAKEFADTLYTALLTGESVGQALLAGRRKLRGMPSVDWADYIHYGAFDFRLKVP